MNRNLNKELSKNGSFTSLSLELLRYTEYYSEYFQNKGNQSLAASNFIMDFVKDLNIRDIQFAQLLENYKLSVNKLSQYSCFDCPRFKKHVRDRFNQLIYKNYHVLAFEV